MLVQWLPKGKMNIFLPNYWRIFYWSESADFFFKQSRAYFYTVHMNMNTLSTERNLTLFTVRSLTWIIWSLFTVHSPEWIKGNLYRLIIRMKFTRGGGGGENQISFHFIFLTYSLYGVLKGQCHEILYFFFWIKTAQLRLLNMFLRSQQQCLLYIKYA